MKKILGLGATFVVVALAIGAAAQRDKDQEEPTAVVNFLILKDDNGKPVRNAAIVMHPVSTSGKQGRGGIELKSDVDGKSSFDGIPYGKLRVQIISSGFQTYGDDFDVNQARMELTIKLKRPKGQYSVYDDPAKNSATQHRQEPPPADKDNQKPN
jgi:hypothetical protein